jgi:glycerol-3-phosphate dehydrogenase
MPAGMNMAQFDVAIVGGGVNGTAVARDAAGRGLKVLLVEQGDLASGTSSASSKLMHGGLRYLARRKFRLVAEALREREVMMRTAPHLVHPLRFVLPTADSGRSVLALRLGLFIYDRLGGRKSLPGSAALNLTHHAYGAPLRRRFTFGFEYSDCHVDDSRLVVLNAVDAAERGAVIRTRTRCMRADRAEEWTLILNARGRREVVSARSLVNAAGPWVSQVAETVLRAPSPVRVRLVKGSHIVVPRMFEHSGAYVLPLPDRRIVFALPFADNFTLIGTTEQDFVGDLAAPAPTAEEVAYLCAAANAYFRHAIDPADVVWSFAGVRALCDDGAANAADVSRKYILALDRPYRGAPLLTVYGGKITTARRLAETAVSKIAHFFVCQPAWTAHAPLPGGEFAGEGVDAHVAATQRRWPFLAPGHARRLALAYGVRTARVLADAQKMDDLGARFGPDLTEAEVLYLMRHEWAETADDILWRRSKTGLAASKHDREALAGFMTSARASNGLAASL